MKFAPLLFFVLIPLSPVVLIADEQRAKAPGADTSDKVDLNTATAQKLESVPEIGPQAARAIIAARPFSSVDDLDRVKGISAEQLEQIRAKVFVSTPPGGQRLGEPTREQKPLGQPTAATTDSALPDINTASLETLAAIPVIGPDLAPAIVAARPFKTLDALSQLKGVNAERLEQVRAVVTIAPPSRARHAAP